MKKILPLNLAVYGTIIIFSCTIAFHFLVLAGLVPSTIVWGGNFTGASQLYVMEAISILLNMVMLFVILLYGKIIRLNINRKILKGAVWFMFLLFLLNTVGNLLAKNSLETYIFTPITFILAIFCLRIAAFEHS